MAGRRLALALLCALCLLPAVLRHACGRSAPPRDCAHEGRGRPPRHWIGCATDPGPPRALDGRERLLLDQPIDPNTATADELAQVPGLSPRLGAAVVAERRAGGHFGSLEALEERVRGIGPARLARARRHLAVEGPDAAAPGASPVAGALPDRAGDGHAGTR